MRYILLLLLLTGCSVHAATSTPPPTGEQVFKALLKNGNIELATEPLCKANINLLSQLSLALSVSYENENITTIKSSCAPSKFEKSDKMVINMWDCTVQINENNKQGEFISSSTFVFSMTKGKKEFIKGSLRCR